MFKKSDNYKQEYCAQIVKIGELVPIENSDFLARTVVNGFNVVVGKDDVKEGDIMVYAKLETEVNADFLSVNNQFEIGERHLNKNYEEVQSLIDEGKTDEAKKLVGYFNKFGRVRIVKLRKCPSEGCLFKIDSLVKWKPEIADYDFSQCFVPNEDGVVEPFCFDTIGGDLFVKAWVPRLSNKEQARADKAARRNRRLKRFDRMIEGQFSQHYDTQQLNDNMWRFNPDTVVTISTKWHGCVERSTIVDTIEFGKKTIGEIVDNKIDCHIKAYDVESSEIVYVPIDNFYCIPNDGEWYEIELEDGRKITITGNNPVYLPQLNCYRRVDELTGDEILLVDDMKELKIKKITKLPDKHDRYDLTVSATNNFFANGILIHNTSHIVGRVLIKKPLHASLPRMMENKKKTRQLKHLYKAERRFYWQKAVVKNKIAAIKSYLDNQYTVGYGNVTSSRTVIKNQYLNPYVTNGFYGVDVWTEYGNLLYPYLIDGMEVFSEIIGYVTGSQSMIQKGYDYGCAPGTNRIMPYRITVNNPDGGVTEWDVMEVYGWTLQLLREHPELKDKVVPLDILYHGTLGDLYPDIDPSDHWNENVLAAMKNDKEHFGMEGNEPACKNKVPREGIVVRIDGDVKSEAWKLKCETFKLREAKQYDVGEVDVETAQAY